MDDTPNIQTPGILSSEASPSGRSLPPRILLVEDDLINRKVVLHMLKTMGCSADCAVNGQEAVEVAAKQRYDLILMDMQMPVMDGLEAAMLLRKMKHTEMIVALTADAAETDRLAATQAGMNGFLSKPVSADDLHAVLIRLQQHSS